MGASEGNSTLILVVYSIIAVASFLGNSLVLLVFITKPSYLRRPYNIFIFSLAVTDVITSILLIFSRYLYLPPAPEGELSKEIYCRVIWSATLLFTYAFISVYTAMALTIERWLAVVKPLVYRSVKPHHAAKAVAFVWIWPLLTNLATFWRVKFDKTKQKCTWIPLKVANDGLPWVEISLQSIIPYWVMITLYAHVFLKMRNLAKTNVARYQAMKKTTMIAFVVCTTMVVASLPSRITFMLTKMTSLSADGKLHSGMNTMMLANSVVNPILYGIFHTQLRSEYKAIFLYVINRFKRSTTDIQPSGEGETASETQL